MISDIMIYYITFVISYYVPSILLFACDYYKFCEKYKIQKHKANETINTYKKCYKRVLYNTLILPIPISYVFQQIIKYNMENITLFNSIYQLIMCYILTDIFFYIIHRISHLPILYKYHKIHHRITAPVGYSGLYMHWIDLVGNVTAVYGPLIIIKPYYFISILWIILTTIDVVLVGHGGYKIDDFHNKHHQLFTINYGTNVFMDTLFGTKY